MSEILGDAVATLRHTGALLAEAAARVHAQDCGVRAFGGDGPGELGELGRAMHGRWQAGLDARAREAAAHSARVDDLADGLAQAGTGYADIDHATSKQQPEVP
jgi:hypothetical protein